MSFKFFRHGQPSTDGTGRWDWVLIDAENDLPELRKKFGNNDIYVTVQSYTENQITTVQAADTVSYEINGDKSNCPYVAPLYFDLDCQDADISRLDAKKVVDYLVNEFQVPLDTIEIYFSGKKGFHILIDPVSIGLEPRSDWHTIMKLLTGDIAKHLELSTWDRTVYSARRMLRLPNSKHASTGLYKIPLTRDQLDLSMTAIKKLAATTQPDVVGKPVQNDELKLLNNILESAMRQKLASDVMANMTAPEKLIEAIAKNPTPDCIVDLLDRGIWREGDRNTATMALASYYKCAGKPLDQATADIIKWAKMLNPKLTSTHGTRLTVNTRSVVETVYREQQYVFKCPFILSLGEKQDRIRCSGRMCPLNESNLHKAQDSIEIPLSDAYVASMVGKKVKTKAIVAVAPNQPFIIPYKVRMNCSSSLECKSKNCALNCGRQLERVLDASEQDVLKLCYKTEGQEKAIIGSYLNCSGCKKFNMEIVEYKNVFDIMITTALDYRSVAVNDDEIKDRRKEKYFSMMAFFIGERLPEFNKRYVIEGYILPHPKDNRSVLLTETFDTENTILDSFELSEGIKESFPLFRPQTMSVADVKSKFAEIAEDLAEKSFQLHCRNEVMQAILLVFHSVLQFSFDGRLLPRGWMDLLIVGDSGEGKSFATRSFMDMVRLGDYASGESSKRTGLVYSLINQADGKWYVRFGKYVQMDGQALVIDEAAELAGSELGKFTASRSTGVITVDQCAAAEAYCRTRLIFIANPRSKRHISKFKFPVDSVNEVFESSADVRRLDLAIILNKNDVDSKDMNVRARKQDPVFMPEVMRNSVVWAWTRKPDQVIFTKEAEEKVLEYSIKLWDSYQHDTIELIPKGDTREKVARISVALATLIKSTDATGEKVIVTPEIVTVVFEYISALYDSYGLKTASYVSQSSGADTTVIKNTSESRLEFAIRKGRASFQQLKDIIKKELGNDDETINHLLSIVCRMDNFRIRDLATTLGLDIKRLGSLFRTLMSNNFIIYSSGSHSDTYIAAPKLQTALRFMIDEESTFTKSPDKSKDPETPLA